MVYVVGGEGRTEKASKKMEIFDIDANKWTNGPKLKWTRESFGIGVIDRKIYFVGGQVLFLLKL